MSDQHDQQAANQDPKKPSVTVRLKIDTMPKDLVKLSDQRTIALLWGREINIQTGKPLGFRRAKLWNRAGETLLKIMKDRGLSRENPMTIDLTGVMKPDKREKKDALEASFFEIVGDPQRAKGNAKQDKKRAEENQEPAKAPKETRTREKREFEHDIAVTGILDLNTRSDGSMVAELVGMKKEEWEKSSAAQREDDSRMFKLILAGHIAGMHEQISKAAAWNGPYMDLSAPVVIRIKGTWQKLDGEAEATNAPYRPFVFHATNGAILSGPNFTAPEKTESKAQEAQAPAAQGASGPVL